MKILGIDIGGTNIRAGLIDNNALIRVESMKLRKNGTEKEILDDLNYIIKKFMSEKIEAIGIGVPSLVDAEKGIVYDAANIPAWKKVNLKEQIEVRNKIPVYINNDANCFVIGEKYFGEAKNFKNIVGLIIGTGLGSGLILNNHLYNGNNYGAGEFGMIPYKDYNYEYYCSGQFFINEFDVKGEEVFRQAELEDEKALNIFDMFGNHLGEAVKTILFAVDPEIIVIGGSVRKSYKYFENSMRDSINNFSYKRSLESLKISVSKVEYSAILGAAALCYESFDKTSPPG
jgi:glucokinase